MTACAEFNLVQRKVSPSRRVGLLVDGYEHHDYVVRPKDKTPPAAAGLDEHLVRASDSVLAIKDGERLAPAAMTKNLIGVDSG